MTYVLFDIGGTRMRVALSEDLKTLSEITKFDTPADPQNALKNISAVISGAKVKKLTSIAGGMRGVLNEERTGVHHDGILDPKWHDFLLAKELEKKHAVPVFLENDTALAGLGEATFGAGEGVGIVVYHTISTGVGGAKIEDGVIDVSSVGFEPGHQILDIDRTILGADVAPTLENLVSGTAVENRMGVKAYDIPQDDVIWEQLAGYLAQGLRNTILYWSPEVIILGGSMMVGDPRIPIDMVRKYTVEALDNFVPCPFITTATLNDEAGLYGAMALLEQKL